MPALVSAVHLSGTDHLLALFIVCIGIGSAGYAAFRGDRLGCIVVALLGVLWLWVNKPVEGDILLTLTQHHGITTADLFSVLCFSLAAFGWNRSRRTRQQARPEVDGALPRRTDPPRHTDPAHHTEPARHTDPSHPADSLHGMEPPSHADSPRRQHRH